MRVLVLFISLVLAAVNEALEKSRELAAERMSAYTAGLDIPGLV